MTAEILKDITNYVDFLRSTGYCVMLSCFSGQFAECLPTLLEYEAHQIPVCAYLKSRRQTFRKCVSNKQRLREKTVTEPYYACCYAGVEEYVYPICCGEQTVMCINVSGYRGKHERSHRCMQNTAKLCNSDFERLYMSLSESVPQPDEITKMLRPLEYMIHELYHACSKHAAELDGKKAIFHKAITFIYDNYMNNITCKTIAAAVNYSPSYLQSVFKSECGISVAEYINRVRMAAAKEMLENSNSRITDIAYACAFTDSNYFSAAFKKRYGISPRQYRHSVSK